MDRKLRVLIADDQLRARQGLKALLATIPLDVDSNQTPAIDVVGEAEDGAQALRLSEQFQPDVILMDAHMPDVDGLTATRLIKAQQPSVRIVVLTVYGSERKAALAAGADAFLLKGCPLEQLIAGMTA
jgi:DNA-binding NarL/FixJ family response regulator